MSLINIYFVLILYRISSHEEKTFRPEKKPWLLVLIKIQQELLLTNSMDATVFSL